MPALKRERSSRAEALFSDAAGQELGKRVKITEGDLLK